jgi:1-aminocyclopropane-1-carboxylate deaminase/D-cysteine desulfhydrase-like pyridoxal-dependent ACC family enzyme
MSLNATALEKAIAELPRLHLGQLPTPLQPAPRLSQLLGGPTIYFKRDELTGMPLAGNKTRMFEFVLPRILDSGADCVVGGAGVQSNYCRQLTAACTMVGLDVYLVLMPMPGRANLIPQGNLLLDLLMGAQVHIVEAKTGKEVIERMYHLAERLKKEGRRPFVARMANSEDIGLDAAAYVNCALELHRQFEEQQITPDYIYCASADTTQGGLLLGFKALGNPFQVVGINPIDASIFETPVPELIASAARKGAQELRLDLKVTPEEVVNDGSYVGSGYAIPTPACLEAIKLVASLEGIILDPVYSGKAMAGLINHIRSGKIMKGETVVFIHTGGYPAIFAYNECFDFQDQLTIHTL